MGKILIAALFLGGCSGLPKEAIDQGAHAANGYAMAKELARFTDDHDAVMKAVMDYARARERIQHPSGNCGAGCQRDLEYWRRGVEKALGN